jgi:hypothetical protein
VNHKKFESVSVFVDYQEYAAANMNPPVWRSMPSAMIQKVAEVFVLRRQFPLSGLYTLEELVDEENNGFDNLEGTQVPGSVHTTTDTSSQISLQQTKVPELTGKPQKAESEEKPVEVKQSKPEPQAVEVEEKKAIVAEETKVVQEQQEIKNPVTASESPAAGSTSPEEVETNDNLNSMLLLPNFT